MVRYLGFLENLQRLLDIARGHVDDKDGLVGKLTCWAIVVDIASRFVIICGTQITMTPSTLSSARTPCSASWYRASPASPTRSIGLFRLTVSGMCACRMDLVLGSNLASSRPLRIAASVAMMPGRRHW